MDVDLAHLKLNCFRQASNDGQTVRIRIYQQVVPDSNCTRKTLGPFQGQRREYYLKFTYWHHSDEMHRNFSFITSNQENHRNRG